MLGRRLMQAARLRLLLNFGRSDVFHCMIMLSTPLLVVALLAFSWLVYKWTIYALPCLVGLGVAQWAYETGPGWFGAVAVFGAIALLVFGLMRWLFSSFTQPAIRVLLTLAFVTPAVLMSYFIFDDLSAGQMPLELWRQVLCICGSGVAGLIAFVRLAEDDGRES